MRSRAAGIFVIVSVPIQLLSEVPVRFPVELTIPPGFKPARPSTWPRVVGSVEYVDGKLLYMPPCADEQAEVVSGVVYELVAWARQHREFVVGTNEVGMLLGGSVRAADAAIWRRDESHPTGTFRRTPPLLAIEVAGEDDTLVELRRKARWYLEQGVEMVWLVFPKDRQVKVLTAGRTRTFRTTDRLPAPRALEGLSPRVTDLLFQR